jgi:acyl dehydratase
MTGWPDVKPGFRVPPLTRTIELADMIAYAGATWDWHRLHYDPAFLARRNLTRPVVDGQLFGALLAETVQDWLGPDVFLRSLHFRFASLVFAGQTVRCEGEVTEVKRDTMTLALRVMASDPDRVAVSPAGAVVGPYRLSTGRPR